MQRDISVIIDLLIDVESLGPGDSPILIDGSDAARLYNAGLLRRQGYLNVVDRPSLGSPALLLRSLTPLGQEYLDWIREL